MKQLIAEKFDESKVRDKNDFDDIILSQYNLDSSNKINVSDLYMPEEEQDKMEEFIKKNCFKGVNKKIMEKGFPMLRLNYFPSSVRECDRK